MGALLSAGPICYRDGSDKAKGLRYELTIYRNTSSLSTSMPDNDRIQLLQGTLDMLILRTLVFGPRHGHGIAVAIQRKSDELLLVDHGSLYPALQRLERAGLIGAEWGVSDNNRRARYYKLTRAGRRQLHAETGKWEKVLRAVAGVMRPEEAK